MIHEVLTPKDRFDPLDADHPGVGQPCPGCDEPLQAGDRPSLVNGTPASPEDEARAEEGRAHTVITSMAHQRCAYPEDFVPTVRLCETTGTPATVAGFCPVHLGSACIAAYHHHRTGGEA